MKRPSPRPSHLAADALPILPFADPAAEREPATPASSKQAFAALLVAFIVGQLATGITTQYRLTGRVPAWLLASATLTVPGFVLGAMVVLHRERRLARRSLSLPRRLWDRVMTAVVFLVVMCLADTCFALLLRPLLAFAFPPGTLTLRQVSADILGNVPFYLAVAWIVARGAVFHESAWQSRETATNLRLEREREVGLRSAMELRMLRTYMQPHFLFNTLNVIASLTDESPREARRALVTTADLLRSALIDDPEATDVVSVGEEMEVVRHYLTIERLRMRDRLVVEESIDPATLSMDVPRFAVQTLVENAVRHGLFPSARGGVLKIRVARTGDQLRIVVADTGVGCSAHELAHSRGIGLRAVAARLAGLHASGASLVVQTAPGEGFTATIALPVPEDLG